jgi:hypothetical protein
MKLFRKKVNPRKEYARAKEEAIHAGGQLLKKVAETIIDQHSFPCFVCEGCAKHLFLCPYAGTVIIEKGEK